MEIVATPVFTRRVGELLTAESYRILQAVLLDDPCLGAVVPGTGGIREVPWAGSSRGKGGGVRVLYYFAAAHHRLLMLYVFAKNEQEGLSDEQRATIRAVIEAEYG